MSPVWHRSMSPGPDLSIRSSESAHFGQKEAMFSRSLGPTWPLTLGYLGNLPGRLWFQPSCLGRCP